jgi:hypothetical protein
MGSTALNVDVSCHQPLYPVQLRKQPIKSTLNDERTQQVFLGFSFQFFVTEDGQIEQYPEPLNNREVSV